MKRKILVIAGPTAVGKTAYAITAAKALNGEIVSADSMQIYKYMDVGSAKPTAEERLQAVHHLVDTVDPREPFSVAEYQKMAKEAIERVFSSGKLPVVSGGTGLYVNSLLYQMDFGVLPKSADLRHTLEAEATERGNQVLHQRLASLDPASASRIHVNNTKKLIRALEVAMERGEGIPPFERSFLETDEYSFALIGLIRDRSQLYQRIDRRVDLLMEQGLAKEIQTLMDMGLTEDDISMKGIGYKELIACFKGEYDMEEAVRLIKRNTRHYAKRQITWFKRDPHIRWFDLSAFSDENMARDEFLRVCREEMIKDAG